jgi:ligand-binding SRPBCC domain-containing protein
MPVIITTIHIAAPIELCFDLARDMNAHAQSTAHTRERIAECPPGGMLSLGDEVEFEAIHFGIKQRLRSRIIEFDRPHRFVDQMQKGAFKRLTRVHEFRVVDGGTEMIDTLDFASRLGPIGTVVDKLLLVHYMRGFLTQRNAILKKLAEQQASKTSTT